MSSIAVVAHYDYISKFSDSFCVTVNTLLIECSLVIVVSTSPKCPVSPWATDRVMVISRPNIGYDFFSYKVGIDLAVNFQPQTLILTNSSYVVTHSTRFLGAIRMSIELSKINGLVGFTSSRQHYRHLQSYFFCLNSSVFKANFFQSWVDEIWPVDSKLALIQKYELSFTRIVEKNGFAATAIFQTTISECFFAWIKFVRARSREKRSHGLMALLKPCQFNPTLAQAVLVSKQIGIAKIECLTKNPDRINLLDLYSTVEPTQKSNIEKSLREIPREDPTTQKRALNSLQIRNFLDVNNNAEAAKIAVVLHIFYPELIAEMLVALRNIQEPFDLFVTTPKESIVRPILDSGLLLVNRMTICIVDNFGRDVAPFLSLVRSNRLSDYSAVLKIHTKQSKYSEKGGEWRGRLLSQLLPSPHKIAQILATLEQGVTIIGPKADYLSNNRFWGANRNRLSHIVELCGLNADHIQLGFFAGTMFWYNPRKLQQVFDKILKLNLVFETEAGQQDGTLAHALERAIPELARLVGLDIWSCTPYSDTLVESVKLHESQDARVPVLSH
jgi:lipopolysaccharide biosynthesis protein